MKKTSLFVTCSEGLEPLLLDELQRLGLSDLKLGFRGVYAPSSLENIFTINYLSRLATRVLLPLTTFHCPDTQALYNEIKKIDWLQYLDEKKTFAIDPNINHPQIRHSLYGAQLAKDAICDAIREKRDARPSIDVKNPDVQLHLFIHKNQAVLSFDTSGSPLYKRGWKEGEVGEASLPETLAAAILKKAGYSEKEVLCDPFCGAGTFLIEAASIATKTPAGYFRKKWGFFHLPDFRMEEWLRLKEKWDSKRQLGEGRKIIGADHDKKAILLCREYLHKTGFEKEVVLVNEPIAKFSSPRSPTLIVTDPPFGKRMQAPIQLYQEFGQFLRTRCPAAPWGYLLTSSFRLAKATGCNILSEWPLHYGGLRVCLYQVQS